MINKEGFLSADLNAYENKFIEKHSSICNYFKELNVYSQNLAFQLNITNDQVHLLTLAVLFLRSLSNFQSIYILATKGIVSESKILLRTLMELLFIISAIENDSKTAVQYLGQEAIANLAIFKNAKKHPKLFPKAITMEEIDAKIEQLEKEILFNKINYHSVKKFARLANRTGDFETYYAFLCNTSHANISDVKEHFIFGDGGIVKSFNWGPNEKEVPKLLLAVSDVFLKIIRSISISYSINNISEINSFTKNFQ